MTLRTGLLAFVLLLSSFSAFAQFNLYGPAGSESFGHGVAVLPNGNIAVLDPLFDTPTKTDAGAVHVYRGSDLRLISTLTGSQTGDFERASVEATAGGKVAVFCPKWDLGSVVDAGAVALLDQETGHNGPLTASMALHGSATSDEAGNHYELLPNGNILLIHTNWSGKQGAITLLTPAAPLTGPISASNSLTGSAYDDFATFNVKSISNTHFVISFPDWDQGQVLDAGAVVWMNATTGVTGIIGSGNALVGSSGNDHVGEIAPVVLPNGNFLLFSPSWNNGAMVDAGAVTWGSGTAGISGVVSSLNSLVGNGTNDKIGTAAKFVANQGWQDFPAITLLADSVHFVLHSHLADAGVTDAGAITWGDATTGLSGAIGTANSLIGSTPNDFAESQLVALPNGHYVLSCPNWDNGSLANAGAVTWCNGTTGRVGTISAANSLTGSTANDKVGTLYDLKNGHYAVAAPNWDNGTIADAGAAIWCNGTTGRTGPLLAADALVGSANYDKVGYDIEPFATTYAVISPYNDTSRGAVTICSSVTGGTGNVGAANSLTGQLSGYQIGYTQAASYGFPTPSVFQLLNGKYVVISEMFGYDLSLPGGGNQVGAATLWDGISGMVVTAANSLTGSSILDFFHASVKPLSNGNYLVICPYWNNLRGAVAWANGTTGIAGVISSANAFVGTNPDDKIGAISQGDMGTATFYGLNVHEIAGGNYLIGSSLSNSRDGAITWGNGQTGTTGSLDISNSATPRLPANLVGKSYFGDIIIPIYSQKYLIQGTFYPELPGPWGIIGWYAPNALTVGKIPTLYGEFSPEGSLYNRTKSQLYTDSSMVFYSRRWPVGGTDTPPHHTLFYTHVHRQDTGDIFLQPLQMATTVSPSGKQAFWHDPTGSRLVAATATAPETALYPTFLRIITLGSEVHLSGNGNSIYAGQTTMDTADFTDLGVICGMGGSITRTFVLYNRGIDTLTLSQPVSSSPQFSISQLSKSSLLTGDSTTFTVTYTPALAGADSTTISFITNDFDEGNFTFSVRGTNSTNLPAPTITQAGPALSTGAFATYQWLLNGQPVNGATSQTFTATQNGAYTVAVTDSNGCTGMSAAVNVIGIRVDARQLTVVRISPNPTSGLLTISSDQPLSGNLYTLTGEKVMAIESANPLDLSALADGVYLLHLRAQDGSEARVRVVKMQ